MRCWRRSTRSCARWGRTRRAAWCCCPTPSCCPWPRACGRRSFRTAFRRASRPPTTGPRAAPTSRRGRTTSASTPGATCSPPPRCSKARACASSAPRWPARCSSRPPSWRAWPPACPPPCAPTGWRWRRAPCLPAATARSSSTPPWRAWPWPGPAPRTTPATCCSARAWAPRWTRCSSPPACSPTRWCCRWPNTISRRPCTCPGPSRHRPARSPCTPAWTPRTRPSAPPPACCGTCTKAARRWAWWRATACSRAASARCWPRVVCGCATKRGGSSPPPTPPPAWWRCWPPARRAPRPMPCSTGSSSARPSPALNSLRWSAACAATPCATGRAPPC